MSRDLHFLWVAAEGLQPIMTSVERLQSPESLKVGKQSLAAVCAPREEGASQDITIHALLPVYVAAVIIRDSVAETTSNMFVHFYLGFSLQMLT